MSNISLNLTTIIEKINITDEIDSQIIKEFLPVHPTTKIKMEFTNASDILCNYLRRIILTDQKPLYMDCDYSSVVSTDRKHLIDIIISILNSIPINQSINYDQIKISLHMENNTPERKIVRSSNIIVKKNNELLDNKKYFEPNFILCILDPQKSIHIPNILVKQYSKISEERLRNNFLSYRIFNFDRKDKNKFVMLLENFTPTPIEEVKKQIGKLFKDAYLNLLNIFSAILSNIIVGLDVTFLRISNKDNGTETLILTSKSQSDITLLQYYIVNLKNKDEKNKEENNKEENKEIILTKQNSLTNVGEISLEIMTTGKINDVITNLEKKIKSDFKFIDQFLMDGKK